MPASVAPSAYPGQARQHDRSGGGHGVVMRTPPVEIAVPSRDALGETPLWCERTRRLWWLDVEAPAVQCFDPASGRREALAVDADCAGSLALTRSGELLVGADKTLQICDSQGAVTRALCSLEPDLDTRLNDGRVDAAGRFYVGTLDTQLSRPICGLYRIDADGSATRLAGDIIVTNGVTHAPDDKTLYFTDTRRFQTFAFDKDPDDGTLSNRRVFADYTSTKERPDGAVVDVDGCVWTVFFGGARVVRYRPDGGIDRCIELPVTNPTCPCFGGSDFSTLFITTARKFLSEAALEREPLAGSVLAIEGIGQGFAEHRLAL